MAPKTFKTTKSQPAKDAKTKVERLEVPTPNITRELNQYSASLERQNKFEAKTNKNASKDPYVLNINITNAP